MPDQLTMQDIERLAKTHEGPDLEYKDDFMEQADRIAHRCVGLANSGGGTFLLGISDDGTITGVPKPAKAYDRLAAMLRNCDPPLTPAMGWVATAPDRGVVYARMAPGRHLYKGVFYVRNGTSTEVGTFAQLDQTVPARAPFVLPEQFSPPISHGFRGRHADLAELRATLSARRSIVVVDGISGIGKSALLAAFASSMDEHSVCWLECTPESSFGNLIEAFSSVARAKGFHPLADAFEDPHGAIETRLQRCAAALAGSSFLLFLDDYHLVVDPLLDRFVQRVTERATHPRLFLACRVRPKVFATLTSRKIKEVTLEEGLDVESCRALLNDENVDVTQLVGEKIWRLTGEGHPKALELFIGRTRTYSVEYLLARLPPFQEQLKEQWLQPLLDEVPPDARALAVAMSVFTRPVALAALPALFPEIGNVDAALTQLLDRFLLNRTSSEAVRMHPLVREFCYDQLGDREAAHARAATFYLEVLPEVPSLGDGEVEAVTAAWSHLLKAKEYDRAGTLINAWRGTLLEGGYFEELIFIIDNSAEIFSEPEREHLHERLRLDRARILSAWGESEEAISIVTPLVGDASSIPLMREAVLILATVHADAGELERARKVLEAYQKLFRDAECPPRTKRRFLARLADVLARDGNLPRAFQMVQQLVELCDAERDEVGGARALRQLADVLFQQKKTDLAADMAAHSLSLATNLRETALTRVLLGQIEHERGDVTRASEYLEQALDSFTRMRDRRNASTCRTLLGAVASA